MNRTVAFGRGGQSGGPPQGGGPRGAGPQEHTQILDVAQLPTRFEFNGKMGAVFFAVSEILTFASYVPELGSNLPSADVLRNQFTAMFERMNQSAREGGASPEDARDMQYALAAFVDEQILRAQWNGRYEWQQRPLQLQWFGENTAGDNFFERMNAVSRQPARAHVLQVYLLCLAYGFQGRHGMQDPQSLAPMIEQASLSLTPALLPFEPLSPKGVRPARPTLLGDEAPIVRMALAFFGVALGLFLLLRLVLGLTTSSAEKAMQTGASTATAAPGAAK